MKKYLMSGIAAMVFCAAFTSCSNKDDFEPMTQSQIDKAKYDYVFLNYIGGSVAAGQDWGFTSRNTRGMAFTRAVATTVDGINAPFTSEELSELVNNAKEVTTATASQNWSGSADFAVEMKITGTWDGNITVAASEDWGEGDTPETGRAHRNIYVTGTWNLGEYQKIGGKGSIVIAPTGKLVLSNGAKIEMVNQARLVVLRGGEITGQGEIIVNNGNAEGYENFNAGTINITKFNNNSGKFYNYGSFNVNEYDAGSTESNFYNHAIVNIDHTGTTPNARVYNGCQFYVKNDARLRNYEGVNGSALIVGGQFMPFGSADLTTTPSFVSLAAGALVKCGSLYNGASWTGPTENGYAALEIVNQIDYMTWVQDSPETGGYFANNIYVKCGTWNNDPEGQGYHNDNPADEYNYMVSRADYKFFSIAANCTGNGNVTKVEDGTYQYIPASEGFVLGEKECTPGFKMTEIDDEVYDIRIMGEDLSAAEAGDFDFNDIVLDVKFGNPAKLCLRAAGGRLPLRIAENDEWEVHKLFKVGTSTMVNTGVGNHKQYAHVKLELNKDIADAAAANGIKLEVFKNNEWQELTARISEPAAKIAVPVTTDEDWLDERVSIKEVKKNFVEWASENKSRSTWWTDEE
jgi:hypothetical protein